MPNQLSGRPSSPIDQNLTSHPKKPNYNIFLFVHMSRDRYQHPFQEVSCVSVGQSISYISFAYVRGVISL